MFFNITMLRITLGILSLVAEIDEFKGAWQAMGRISPKCLSSLLRIVTIESIGFSIRIEGTHPGYREVEQLLKTVQSGSCVTSHEPEIAGYAEVMETILTAYNAIALTENHIRQLHRDLLAYSLKDERHRGVYKMLSNNVEAFGEDGKNLGIVFKTASPFDTSCCMTQLV